jgi:hypothetical protein
MDDKTFLLHIYITTNNNESNKQDSTSNDEVGNNQQWGGGFVDTKLLNIFIIVHYGASRWNPKTRRIFLNENC